MCRSRPERLLAWLVSVFVALLLAEAPASANGRFPRAEQLMEDPADPSWLMLAATYGLLTSSDRGATWYHTCEAAFATQGYVGDPVIDFVAGHAVLIDVQATINRSSDWCGWTPTLVPSPDSAFILDFSVDRAHGRQIVVAVVSSLIDGSSTFVLQQSTDGGLTWAAIGTPLPLSLVLTVDLDPTDATHIYASGLSATGQGTLLTSTDHGMTWAAQTIVGADASNLPYIASIHPDDPKKVFVRTDSTLLKNGSVTPNDALLYSSDGGSTWTELLRKTAKLLGFALSPDGSKILAGYGDPNPAIMNVDPSQLGIYEASTSDWQFAPVFGGQSVTCLTWTAAGTYVCTAVSTAAGFEELGFFPSGTLVPGASAPTPLMRFSDIKGPPPCCSGTGAVCDWSSICTAFTACSDSGTSSMICDAGSPPDAGEMRDAGPDAGLAPPGTRSSGCGCRVGAARSGPGAAWLGWALASSFAWRRRRRGSVTGGHQRRSR